MLKIAINGFGRIGRSAFKIALTKKNMQVAAINDLGSLDNMAYLLKYDSVYGRYNKTVKTSANNLIVDGKKYAFYSVSEPEKLPWKKLKVDIVLECTGAFTRKEDAEKHLKAGAKKVVISAPSESKGVPIIVLGVNEEEAKEKNLIATGSCTTNCVSPIMAVLESEFGVEKALLTTVHSATADQKVVDLPSKKDWRRGRAVEVNIIPSTTGAAFATTLTLPSLKNKFDGVALRVPVVCGSIADIVALLKKNVTVQQVNNVLRKASKQKRFNNILAVTDDELVSTDIIATEPSAIVDLKFTRVVGKNLVKILAWYDNEWAHSLRLVEIAEKI